MKTIFTCICMFLFLNLEKGYSQKLKTTFMGYGGASIGPETGIGLAKCDIVAEFGNENKAFYVGTGASIWFLFAAWGSINVNSGFRYKNFIFDTSISKWKYLSGSAETKESDQFSHCAINPKIGVQIKMIRFKVGPSIIFGKSQNFPEKGFGTWKATKIGRQYYNFELAVPFDFYKYF